MCGIFGAISKTGKPLDLIILRRIALVTESRGRHAFGLAWLDAGGHICTQKRPGPISANLGDFRACRKSPVIIGHCRWATHGDPLDNRNNHPHRAGRGVIVHNGVVRNYAQIAQHHRLTLTTECDSEVLGLLISKLSGSVGMRTARMAELAEGNLAILGLWSNPLRLVFVRNGNPLSVGETKDAYYFASLPLGLPGSPTSLDDQLAGVLTSEGGRLKYSAYTVEPTLFDMAN